MDHAANTVPVTIITGFLGSGKTTVLNHLLRQPSLADTVVIVNEGVAKNLSTSTLKDDAYAFIFDQQGLMAGVSIEGSKISRIRR